MTIELISNIAVVLFALLIIVAASADFCVLRIPNYLSVILAVAFFPFACASGMSPQIITQHLASGSALLALGWALFALNFYGGGDAKLMAAAGLWLGVECNFLFLSWVALIGGALGLACFLCALSRDRFLHDPSISHAKRALKARIPYGFAIAVGAILAIPTSWLGAGLGMAP